MGDEAALKIVELEKSDECFLLGIIPEISLI